MATGRCSRLSDGWLFWCSLTPRHRSGTPLPSAAVWQLVLGCMDAPASVSGPSFLRFLFRLVVSFSLALALRLSFVVFSLLFLRTCVPARLQLLLPLPSGSVQVASRRPTPPTSSPSLARSLDFPGSINVSKPASSPRLLAGGPWSFTRS